MAQREIVPRSKYQNTSQHCRHQPRLLVKVAARFGPFPKASCYHPSCHHSCPSQFSMATRQILGKWEYVTPSNSFSPSLNKIQNCHLANHVPHDLLTILLSDIISKLSPLPPGVPGAWVSSLSLKRGEWFCLWAFARAAPSAGNALAPDIWMAHSLTSLRPLLTATVLETLFLTTLFTIALLYPSLLHPALFFFPLRYNHLFISFTSPLSIMEIPWD